MKTTFLKRALSLLLAVAMLGSLGITALADDPTFAPSVTISGDTLVHVGATASVTATVTPNPPAGWEVDHIDYAWTGLSGYENHASGTIGEATSVSVTATVTYKETENPSNTRTGTATSDPYTIQVGYSISAVNGVGYTIAISPAPNANDLIAAGANVTATLTPATGYQLNTGSVVSPASVASLSDDVTFTASNPGGGPVAIKKTLTVNYAFDPNSFGITAEAPAAGTASYDDSFAFATVTKQTVDDKEYELKWIYDGSYASQLTDTEVNNLITGGTTEITVHGQWVEVEPDSFEITLPAGTTTYTVTKTIGTPVTGNKYTKDTTITFEVTPAAGYKIDTANINCAGAVKAAGTNESKATFAYTVGTSNATLALSDAVKPITLTVNYDLDLRNGTALTANGTAALKNGTAVWTAPASTTFNFGSTTFGSALPTTGTLTGTAAAETGKTYEFKGWTISYGAGTSFATNVTKYAASDMVQVLNQLITTKNLHADTVVTLKANWAANVTVGMNLNFNCETLYMGDALDDISIYNQLLTKEPTAKYIKFTSLGSATFGTLYEGGVRTSANAVNTSTMYALNTAASGSTRLFQNILFVPRETAELQDYVATFDLYAADGTTKLSEGTLKINTGRTADIVWRLGSSEDSIQFNSKDFYDFYYTASSRRTLDYVEFTSGFTFGRVNGYISYGNTSSQNYLTERDFNRNTYYYEATGSDEAIDKLYYCIGSAMTGYREIEFTCYGAGTGARSTFTQNGTLVILLDEEEETAAASDLIYNVKYDSTLQLDSADFAAWAGSGFSYIIFDEADIARMRGVLTTTSGRTTYTLGYNLDAGTPFYAFAASSSYSKIDDLIYTPESRIRYSRYADQIGFTAYKSNGTAIGSGIMTICVLADNVETISLTVDPGKSVAFNVQSFKNVASKAIGSSTTIDSIVLNQLPTSGTIYHDSAKAAIDKNYSLGTTGSALVSKLSYTAANKNGKYTVDYTAYSGSSILYVGKIQFTVGDNTTSAGSITATGLAIPTTTLINAAKSLLDKSFDYMTVEQPSNAIVYEDYTTINKHNGAAASTTKYYEKSATGKKAISALTVVPYADRTNKEVIKVVCNCYDTDGNNAKVTLSFTFSTVTRTNFSDTTDSWYMDSIYFLNQNNIVNGVSTTKYGVGQNIKRGDFILMLYRAFNLDKLSSSTASGFTDVKSSDYYASAINAAKALGITNGYTENGKSYFRPENPITREEAFALIYRTLSLSGVKSTLASSLPTASSSTLNSFTDNAKIQSFAKDAVAVLVKAGLVKGSDGKINPANPISREEMAVILHRALTMY